MTMYKDIQLFINGQWTPSVSGRTLPVINPATEEVIGHIPHANTQDLDAAVAAAEKGFEVWRNTSAFERYKIMRRAADILRERADDIARIMTLEQGKPFAEAKGETVAAADTVDWFAEEARRTYGRVVPARAPGVYQMVIKEPVGIVAAFTPWNFPINQIVRKLSASLAAGCSFIVKAPEETPGSPAELIRAFADAGVPAGVIGLVYGIPAEISEYLIPHPAVKKISFTGSTPVGKHLAALAGTHMKRATMELGGHAPAIVFDDADIDAAVKNLVGAKFRNAGQVCVSPTRFLVQKGVFNAFVEKFVAAVSAYKVGDGLSQDTTMGPVVNERRLAAVEALVADAIAQGAELKFGGKRLGDKGYFYAPTVLTNIPLSARAMNEEPFGPVALINSFDTLDEVIAEANRLPFGLAAYAFSASAKTTHALATRIESGMVTINHLGLALPEIPFGGIKESGYGSEGGTEGIEAYINTKLVTQLDI
jgi:succinate-semialdehyde dehydrogenase/glutarate-semialdehyde dehydrogenase